MTLTHSSSGLKETAAPDWTLYVDQTAKLLELSIPESARESVVENFTQIAAIAQLVNEFPLPDSIEIAPRFQP